MCLWVVLNQFFSTWSNALECFGVFSYRVNEFLCVISTDQDLQQAFHLYRGQELAIQARLPETIFPLEVSHSTKTQRGSDEHKMVPGSWDDPDDSLLWNLEGFQPGKYRLYAGLASDKKVEVYIGIGVFGRFKPKDCETIFKCVNTKERASSYSKYNQQCHLVDLTVHKQSSSGFLFVIPKGDWDSTHFVSLTLEYMGK